MDVLNKSISETKKLLIDVEDRKKEVDWLASELAAEEQIVSMLKKELDCIRQQNANLQLSSGHYKSRAKLVRSFCDVLKSTTLRIAHLRKFVEKSEPTTEQQRLKKEHLKSTYKLMLEKYEESPLFQAILQEQSTEKDLAEKIVEKRNELMKLEIDLNNALIN